MIVTFFHSQGIPPNDWVKIVELHLKGEALRFWTAKKVDLTPEIVWPTLAGSLSIHFREKSDMMLWNLKVKDFRQAPRESIIDYGFRFDAEIVESYPSLGPYGKPIKDMDLL